MFTVRAELLLHSSILYIQSSDLYSFQALKPLLLVGSGADCFFVVFSTIRCDLVDIVVPAQ